MGIESRRILKVKTIKKIITVMALVSFLMSASAVYAMSDKKMDENSALLLTACQQSNADIVKIVLARGADINIQNKHDNTALIYAADQGHNKVVDTLIAAKASLDIRGEDGDTALMCAARWGYNEIVNSLLQAGAQIDAQNKYRFTALIVAAKKGHIEAVKALLSAHAQVDAQMKDESAAMALIRRAIAEENLGIIGLLIKAGVDVNEQRNNGSTVLMWAAYQGNVEIANRLITAGACVNIQNKGGFTALMVAAENGHVSIINGLLDARARVDMQGHLYGTTALMFAIEHNHVDAVKALLREGRVTEQISIRDKAKDTALLRAIKQGYAPIVSVLVQAGVRLPEGDDKGCIALMDAARQGQLEIVKILIQASAEVNAQQGKDSHTALIRAAQGGHVEVIKELVKARAHVNKQCGERRDTALGWAAYQGHVAAVTLLLEVGADIDMCDERGYTPLMEAADQGHSAVIEAILARQTDERKRVFLVNRITNRGNPVMFVACRGGHLDVVRQLLYAGACINGADILNDTVLFDAVKDRHRDVVKTLVLAGARSDIPNESRATAWSKADADMRQIIMSAQHERALSGLHYRTFLSGLALGEKIWGPLPEEVKEIMAEYAATEFSPKDRQRWKREIRALFC